ncbi:hypothetical protein HMPREF9597_01478 [Cutibacterium acnes HL005PA4]|nr:hypothetical protein HMPREF9597_01478 [Cutibacterium acnes HL005PA4]
MNLLCRLMEEKSLGSTVNHPSASSPESVRHLLSPLRLRHHPTRLTEVSPREA